MKAASKKTSAKSDKDSSSFQKKNDTGFFKQQPASAPFFGNSAYGSSVVQPKLTVGEPHDQYEKEADSTADRVVQHLNAPRTSSADHPVQNKQLAPGISRFVQEKCDECEEKEKKEKKEEKSLQRKPVFADGLGRNETVQRKCADCEAEENNLQRKESSRGEGAVSPSVESKLSNAKGGGSALPAAVNQSMSNAFGADFSHVRVHTGPDATQMSRQLNAQAFTHGSDIYFNAGKYDTSSKEGQHLLAHELTHTIQQGSLNNYSSFSVSRMPSVQKEETKKNIKDLDADALKALGEIKEGFLSKDKGKVGVHFKDFPSKQYVGPFVSKDNAGNEYIAGPPFKKPTAERKTKQSSVWKKEALPKATTLLNNFIKKKNVTGTEFELKLLKKKDVAVTGTVDQIANQVTVPFWGMDGLPLSFQIEHKVDWQIAGGNHNVDVISNLILLDAKSNIDIGQKILADMKAFYSKVIDYFAKQKNIEGLEASFSAGSGVYDIFCENLISVGQPVTGSLISISNFEEKATQTPFTDQNIDITDLKIPDDKFVLKTSKSGAGMFVPWNLDNEYISIKGDQKTKTLQSITLKNVVKDDKGVLDKNQPDKELKFYQDGGQSRFKVDSAGYAAVLKNMFRGIKAMSPIDWNEDIDFNPITGFSASGVINTKLKLLEGVKITLDITNSNFEIAATITSDILKGKLPSPFQVDYSSLTIAGGSAFGLKGEGEIGFSVTNFGKGHINAKVTPESFALGGDFTPDKKLFEGNIKVSYEKVSGDENGKWTVEGSVTMPEKKIPGLQKLKLSFLYEKGGVTISGKANLTVKAIKEITITGKGDDKGMSLEGTVELNEVPKLKAGSKATLKVDSDWNVSFDGTARPDINIQGLDVKEVKISYDKGLFEISGGAGYKRGRIHGDFTAGVTNKAVDDEGKVTGSEAGKELNFFASGNISVDIAEGIGSEIGVKLKRDGDIILDGTIKLTQDKPLLGKKVFSKTFTPLDKDIPLASCVVVTLNLHIGGDITLYANLNPLQFDAGSNIKISNLSLKKFNSPVITAKLDISSHFDAGVKVGLNLGLNVALLGVLKGGVDARGELDFQAISADANAHFGAKWSSDKGIQLTESTLDYKLVSKLIATLSGKIYVLVDLLFTKITLWERVWQLAKKEYTINLFGAAGKGSIKLPIKEDGTLDFSEQNLGQSVKNVGDSVTQEAIAERSKNVADGKDAGDNVNRQGEAAAVTKDAVLKRFKDPIRFQFDKCVNFLKERYDLYNHLKTNDPHDKNLDLTYVDEEIKKAEYEEYDAFGPWLASDKTFKADEKNLLIDDFMINHPTLGPGHKANLKAVVPKDSSATSKVQRKKEEEELSPVPEQPIVPGKNDNIRNRISGDQVGFTSQTPEEPIQNGMPDKKAIPETNIQRKPIFESDQEEQDQLQRKADSPADSIQKKEGKIQRDPQVGGLLPSTDKQDRYYGYSNEVVDILGKSAFRPSAGLGNYIASMWETGTHPPVNIRIGTLGEGYIYLNPPYGKSFIDLICVDSDCFDIPPPVYLYNAQKQVIRIKHPAFENRSDGTLVYVLEIKDGLINGRFGWIPEKKAVVDPLLDADLALTTEEAFLPLIYGKEYDGSNYVSTLPFVNDTLNGDLCFNSVGELLLPNQQKIQGIFIITNSRYKFEGTLTGQPEGLEKYEAPVVRTSDSLLTAETSTLILDANWTSGNAKDEDGTFTASSQLRLSYRNRILEFFGTAKYASARFNGEVNIALTTKSHSEKLFDQHAAEIAKEKGKGVGMAPDKENPEEPLALTAWGDLHFSVIDADNKAMPGTTTPILKDLEGDAAFVVSSDGFIILAGRVKLPTEWKLTKDLDYASTDPENKDKHLYQYKQTIVDAWVPEAIGSIEVKVGITVDAKAHLDPLTLYEIEISGVYSNHPKYRSEVNLTPKFFLKGYAEASVTASAEGAYKFLGLIKSAKFTGQVTGTARLDAHIDAAPTISKIWKDGDPKAAVYGVSGIIRAGGGLTFTLTGSFHLETFGVELLDTEDYHIGSWTLKKFAAELKMKEYILGSGEKPDMDYGKMGLNDTQRDWLGRSITEEIKDKGGPKHAGGFEQEEGGKMKEKGTFSETPPPPRPDHNKDAVDNRIEENFLMGNTLHDLVIIIGGTRESPTAILKMASGPEEPLIEKIEAEKDAIKIEKAVTFDPVEKKRIDTQLSDLQGIEGEAKNIEKNAKETAQLEPVKDPKVAGFDQIDDRIADYAQKYDRDDLGGLPPFLTGTNAPTPATPPTTTPTTIPTTTPTTPTTPPVTPATSGGSTADLKKLKVGDLLSVPYKNGRGLAEVLEITKDFVTILIKTKSSSGNIKNMIPRSRFKDKLDEGEIFVWSELRRYLMNNRPKYVTGLVDQVWDNAVAIQADGKVRDPNPPHEILTWHRSQSRWAQWHMGHKPDHKYSDLVDRLVNEEIDWDKFIEEYNDPNNYHPELPSKNMGHGFEEAEPEPEQ